MPYFLREKMRYNDGTVNDNGYWEICVEELPENRDEWIGRTCHVSNIRGGWHFATLEADDEIVAADSWNDLDCTYLLNPHSRLGWLSPEGEFYGCEYFEHSMIAERVIHKDEQELENEGWVKTYKSQLFPLDPPDYFIGQPRSNTHSNYLTKKQIEVLLEKGYTIRPYDVKDWDGELPT